MKYESLIEDWPRQYRKKSFSILEVIGPNSFYVYLPPFLTHTIKPGEKFAVPEEFLSIIESTERNTPDLNIVLVEKYA
nr:MAG TPA: hypothetical protein [Caudoviricetes sp.]